MLTEQLRSVLSGRLSSDAEIDLHAALDDVLADVGMKAADSGGNITFDGADPIVPSVLATGSAASLGLVAKSVAIAALWRQRGNPGQDIAMDLRVAPHRLCPFYDRKWELLNGYPQGNDFDRYTSLLYTRFYATADGRWVLPQAHYPKQRAETLRLLRTYDDKTAVAEAIGRWDSAERVVMPVVRSTEELLTEPQYTDVLAGLPLIELERIGDSAPEPLPEPATAPLSGVRALGLAHVIAGSGIGRSLALHGADALNIFSPLAYESPTPYHTAHYGMRSARLDLGRDAEIVRELIRTSDVFFTNRRPRVLERYELTPAALAELRPGIIHANVTLHGERGPWRDRAGFDQTAGSVSGMMTLEGSAEKPKLPHITVVNDWIVPWLVTTGIAAALQRRAVEGGSYRVHVSLTRVALWILSLGVFEQEYAHRTAGTGERHAYLDPETFLDDGPTGLYQGVTDQVRMSETPGRYRFGLLPMGSSRPEWLPSA
jgi:crotonobetainyl-CoA:carnitine CoA-transferase CaiB-like acyl-CoA transferase